MENKSLFRFQKIWSRKISLGFGLGKFCLEKKSWYQKKNLSIGFGQKIMVSSFSADGLEIDQEHMRGADRGAGNVTTGGTTAPRVGTDSC